MSLKEIIFAILGALLPILYTAITGERPDFGNVLDLQTFVALVLWLVGLPFSGAQLLKGRLLHKVEKKGAAKLGKLTLKQ
jgi:hypothetical protein